MMEPGLLRAVLALIFVLGLIGVAGWGLRRWQGSRLSGLMQKGRRLVIEEQLYLDPRRRVILLRCDDQEHLLLLGAQQEHVIVTGMKAVPRENA